MAASTIDLPNRFTIVRNARSIVSELPASVPSSRTTASSLTRMRRPPRRANDPGGSPEPPVPSVIAMMPCVPLAAIATRHMPGCT
jgi:hypothetical protein